MRFVLAAIARLKLFFSRPSWLSEVASGFSTTFWGFLVLNTDHQFASEWPSLDLFLQVGNSKIWGVMAVLLGIGQMALFRMIDAQWERPWVRLIGALLVAWIWGGITISTARYAPWPPGLAAYVGWWAVNVYLIVRISWARG